MTPTTLAARMHDGDPLVGVIVKMPAPAHVELVGHLGFDLVVIDTEHGIGGAADLDHHLRAADAADVPAIVRLPALSRHAVQYALDGGAAGIVVPGVESVDTAQAAVRFAHYPPRGVRGFATSTRAGRQTTVPAATHLAGAAESTVVVAQLESREAVENAAAIAAVKGISAIWIGLNDLALDLGRVGDVGAPEVVDAALRVVDAARSAAVPVMVIADSEAEAAGWTRRGARVLLVNLLTVAALGLDGLRSSHMAQLQGGTR